MRARSAEPFASETPWWGRLQPGFSLSIRAKLGLFFLRASASPASKCVRCASFASLHLSGNFPQVLCFEHAFLPKLSPPMDDDERRRLLLRVEWTLSVDVDSE